MQRRLKGQLDQQIMECIRVSELVFMAIFSSIIFKFILSGPSLCF